MKGKKLHLLLWTLVLAAPNGALAQVRLHPPYAPVHQELPTDPYVPGPGEPLSTYVHRVGPVVRDGYVSVQVNVDAIGENIPGDAANEPSIAIDPTNPDRIVIGWRQFDNISSDFRQAGYAYSNDRGQTWTFPGVIEPTVFRSDPVLAADADGNFHYYSLTLIGSSFRCHLFTSFDGGATWPRKTDGFGGDKAWFTIDQTNGIGRNNIYAFWTSFYSCCSGGQFVRSTDDGLSFGDLQHLPGDPYWGTLSVGPDGELYIAGVGVVVLRSDDAKNPGVVPTFSFSTYVDLGGYSIGGAPNPAGLLGQVWIATDHSSTSKRGNVYILQSVHQPGNDPLDVMFARSTDRGVTWSDPVRVNDDPAGTNAWQWFGTMSVAPNGRIDVIWNDTRNIGSAFISEVYYAYSMDGGRTWSPNVAVTPQFDSWVGWPQQDKIGDYYHMISDNGGANLAYAATFNGEQDVYFLRIPQDCNENGVPDDEDLATGSSQDCNGNSVPDECESNEDCNGNTVQDICDIAGGQSLDCNANTVPDECEPQADCNDNGVQDICDVAGGFSNDCDLNEIPDECDPDCNANGLVDACELAQGVTPDCNFNMIPDDCDIATGSSADCNGNGRPDECDTSIEPCGPPGGECPGQGDCLEPLGNGSPGCDCSLCCQTVCDLDSYCCSVDWDSLCATLADTLSTCHPPAMSDDCNGNLVPDECEPDCNQNGVADDCDIHGSCGAPIGLCPGTGDCCNPSGNGTPGCECATCCYAVCQVLPSCCTTVWDDICAYIASDPTICDCGVTPSEDCNENNVPDECESALDCNNNGVRDFCDLASGVSLDCDDDAIPDECEPDTDADGTIDDCDGCPTDVLKIDPGLCGCGVTDADADQDGQPDCVDECPNDPQKTVAGICGCGVSDIDTDLDTVADCLDQCPNGDDRLDEDDNGVPDCAEHVGIPAVSEWSLIILGLLLFVGSRLYFPRHQRTNI